MKYKYWISILLLLMVFIGSFALSLPTSPGINNFASKFPKSQNSIPRAEAASPVPNNSNQLEQSVTIAPSADASENSGIIALSKPENDIPITDVKGNIAKSRGYLTTPGELAVIALKAADGVEPYKDAVSSLLEFVGAPINWPYRTVDGKQKCKEPLQPAFIGEGAPLVYAKALAYHLTGDPAYAESIRGLLLDLTDTYGYGGEVYNGGNQCILNLSWYIPNWIMAADLIEDYPGWTKSDKLAFQTWLANEVYKKTAWASRNRKNNWGSAGSAASGMIADYLWDSNLLLEGDTPHKAYIEHKKNQLDRLNTKKRFDSDCPKWGIQPYGGIPDELERGSSGCSGRWIKEQDGSWTYMMTFLQGAIMHAEFLLRRGDRSLYDNMAQDGSGSILRAIHFMIANPIDPGKSMDWRDTIKPTLEVAYRYYRDAPTANQLGIGTQSRYIGGKSNPIIHFGTITHGFALDENPGLPPVVSPP